jgi:hypothetical protein
MLGIAKRLQTPEFLHEVRLLYTLENWLTLMININLIYGNIIISSGCPFLPGIVQANSDIGAILCEELKKAFLFPSKSTEQGTSAPELMQMFDQLSRFKLDSNSVLKEIQSKLIGKV